MIYTVTFNPALDYLVDVDNLKLGYTNRVTSEVIYPGGKGINVSLVLKNLGIDSTALGFVAGFTGDEIVELLSKRGIHTDFIKIPTGATRINVKLRSKEETEINGLGPDIDQESLNILFNKIDSLKEGDFLVLGGSIPKSMPDDIYEQIAKRIEGKGIGLVVDATKDLLLNVLPYKPFLIKPNNHELAEIFDVELKTNADIAKYAKELLKKGAQNVIVSMAGDGAIFVSNETEPVFLPAPKGKVINSVGAGDSSVAGFLSGIVEELDPTTSFKKGVSTGSASAFSELLAEKDLVDELFANLPEPIIITE